MEEYITELEREEYLAYESAKDAIRNWEQGIQCLLQYPFKKENRGCVLVCGGMIAFDKGLSVFLNKWAIKQEKMFLLSEVTAQYRRYTDEKITIPFICTPHLLAKEIILQNMEISISKYMKKILKKKKYVYEATVNMEQKYTNLGKGYAIAWGYYAYKYLTILVERLSPKVVILWNEFYGFHHIMKGICYEKKIPIYYMEFGCIPGTICIEKGGQQGESNVAKNYKNFRNKAILQGEYSRSEYVLKYLKKTGLNRNIQSNIKMNDIQLTYYNAGRKTILYTGQNDYESGLVPYSKISKKFHSPVFKSTIEGLEFLQVLAIKKNLNLLFKPHPLVLSTKGNEKSTYVGVDCVLEIDINNIIDFSDVVITILSQSAYIALIREKPVVMIGYTQLRGKLCTYEAFSKYQIQNKIEQALVNGYTVKQKENFIKHTAQLLKYYLYDDGNPRPERFGKKIEEIEL